MLSARFQKSVGLLMTSIFQPFDFINDYQKLVKLLILQQNRYYVWMFKNHGDD